MFFFLINNNRQVVHNLHNNNYKMVTTHLHIHFEIYITPFYELRIRKLIFLIIISLT